MALTVNRIGTLALAAWLAGLIVGLLMVVLFLGAVPSINDLATLAGTSLAAFYVLVLVVYLPVFSVITSRPIARSVTLMAILGGVIGLLPVLVLNAMFGWTALPRLNSETLFVASLYVVAGAVLSAGWSVYVVREAG